MLNTTVIESELKTALIYLKPYIKRTTIARVDLYHVEKDALHTCWNFLNGENVKDIQFSLDTVNEIDLYV